MPRPILWAVVLAAFTAALASGKIAHHYDTLFERVEFVPDNLHASNEFPNNFPRYDSVCAKLDHASAIALVWWILAMLAAVPAGLAATELAIRGLKTIRVVRVLVVLLLAVAGWATIVTSFQDPFLRGGIGGRIMGDYLVTATNRQVRFAGITCGLMAAAIIGVYGRTWLNAQRARVNRRGFDVVLSPVTCYTQGNAELSVISPASK